MPTTSKQQSETVIGPGTRVTLAFILSFVGIVFMIIKSRQADLDAWRVRFDQQSQLIYEAQKSLIRVETELDAIKFASQKTLIKAETELQAIKEELIRLRTK